MEDRIEINGEWYVKENSLKSENKKIGFDKLTTDELAFVSKIIYEDSNYLIEFSHKKKNKPWCESSTISINNLSIGEFQVHKHRDCIKFRWCFEKLLKYFVKSFTIINL